MKNLILLTAIFPYEGGEQFIETEIKYWKKNGFDNVYVIPYTYSSKSRSLPSQIKLINIKARNSNLAYGLLSMFNPIFYKELMYILKENKFNNFLSDSREALKTTTLTLKIKNNLTHFLQKMDSDQNTLYCYWNDAQFYAACILKREGLVKNVISRAHGYDIYQERRKNNYMPLKRQFVNDFEKVYLLSESALRYYKETYGANENVLEVSRLGVELPLNKKNHRWKKDKINILSLSYCNSVKQIHKIIHAVYEYAKQNLNCKVEWTHIGDGDLFEELRKEADTLANNQENLTINFLGELKNLDVKDHLEFNYYDVFINASKSEGIPVSIMEAMSYGIPAIAPDVGGVPALVNISNGYLMSSSFTNEDIINGINKIHNSINFEFYRDNAISWISENFNSNLNYPDFIKKVEAVAEINN